MQISKLILFLFLNSSSVFAYCGSSGISVFPNNRELSKNPVFIVEGFARSQKDILTLNKDNKIYLRSGNSKVNLLVLETLIGDFQLTQAVLKPEEELIPGLVYSLEIDNLKNPEILRRFNFETKKFESIEFVVGEVLDLTKPVLTSNPKMIEKSYVRTGCGPAVNVIYDFKVSDNSEVIVKTSLRNKQTNEVKVYYIKLYSNQLSVGHGMCSGPFKLEYQIEYEVEFSAMDAAGNLTSIETDNPYSFTKPYEFN